ncbi:MAG: ATP synthase F0 subunit B [Desulfatibacillaceae bacterium]
MRIILATGLVLAAMAFGQTAWAAEGAPSWRATYDEILLWVNFAILVALIFKFGRQPLKSFLRGEQEEIAEQLDRAEKRRNQVRAELAEMEKKVRERDQRMAQVQERSRIQGEENRKKIIEEARRESENLLQEAKKRSGFQLEEARRQVKNEMIETAVEMALKALPEKIGDEDNKRFVEQYLRQSFA